MFTVPENGFTSLEKKWLLMINAGLALLSSSHYDLHPCQLQHQLYHPHITIALSLQTLQTSPKHKYLNKLFFLSPPA